jgi:hypothetical protein
LQKLQRQHEDEGERLAVRVDDRRSVNTVFYEEEDW